MVKLGVFYCCDNELELKVLGLKTFFKSKCIYHKYIDHPVHSTVYVFNIDLNNFENMVSDFLELRNTLLPVIVLIEKWKVFEKDIMTGLNTLCLEINLTNQLKLVQLEIVNALSKYHLKTDDINYTGELLNSQNAYGYPFIGNHWLPHITIGSLDLKTKLISELCKDKFNFPTEIKINNLNLYIIQDDSHELIEKIKF